MPKVLIGPAPLAKLTGRFLDELLGAGFEPVYPAAARQMTEEELLATVSGIPAVMAGSEPYTRRVFEANSGLRVVARAGVGYDAVDVEAATQHGVVVTITPGANQEAVAEHTFLLMLACAKNLLGQDGPIREGKWPRYANLPLRGQTLGLVGLGRIGKAVAVRALAFRMQVIAYDPIPDHAFAEQYGVNLVSLEELLRESDFVSLHLPMSVQARQLINADTLKLMKPTTYLINTARGGLIDEDALFVALSEKRLAGAGLDVFVDEPPGADNPLCRLSNVVMTAHTAGVDRQSRDEMAYLAAQAIVRLSRGEWPSELIVNPEVKPKFQWP